MRGRTDVHRALIAAALLLTAPAARATAAECLSWTPTDPHASLIAPGTEGGIVYRRVDGRALHLDAFVPRPARGPAVVVLHGGGYTAGSRVSFVGQFLERLGDASIPFVSVEYRLGGVAHRQQAIDDVRAAIAFVRCHADDLGIDPSRLVLLGEDTGAEIALALADGMTPGIVGAALIGSRFTAAPASMSPRAPGVAHPIARAHGPAVLAVHGAADREQPIDTVHAICTERRARGLACEVVPVGDGIHRAENWRPSQWGYKDRLLAWIRAQGGAAVPPAAAMPAPQTTRLPDRLAPGLHKRIVFDDALGLTLDAWIPDGKAPAPAVILVHGGGWEAGDRVTYITPLFAPLARAGFAWFSIDYRLTPDVRHPDQVDDVRRAIAFVTQHAARFGVDPRRVALIGESASGQIAMLLAAGDDSGLAGVVSFYGVYDFAPMVTDAGPRSLATRLFGRTVLDDDTRELLRQYSPLHHVRPGMPPVLLIHGTAEGLWAQGQAMAARLTAIGVRHELVALDGAPHGMENWEGRPEWAHYTARLVDWLRDRTTAH